MSVELKMPALSPTMEEGTLAKWLVKVGDEVKSGDILAEIETDKATMEFEAVDEGTVSEILVEEGAEGVKVGTVIARIGGEGEEAAPAPKPRKEPEVEKASSSPLVGEDQGGGRAASAAPKTPAPVPAATNSTTADAAGPHQHQVKQPPAVSPDAPPHKGEGGAAPAPESAKPQPAPSATEKLVAAAKPAPIADWTGATQKLTVREALRDAMAEEMRADPSVFVMGEEVAEYQGAYKVTQGLLEEFGAKRVIDTPITEYGFAGIGTGAAMGGLKPIIEFMTFNFAMQAIDHIINSAAKTNYMSGGQMRCPIVFRGPNGAASRVGAQHSQNYAPWYASVPGVIVISPYDAADAKGLLRAAIQSPDPVVFLENELLYGRSFEVPTGDVTLPIGKARTMREGKDVTIVSYSIGVGLALEAAEQLSADGIDVEVLDLRTLRPLDTKAVLASLKKTNRMVVAEEGWPTCSIASEIIAICMNEGFDDLDAPVMRVCNEDVPLPYAANLEKLALIDTPRIVAAVKKVCNR